MSPPHTSFHEKEKTDHKDAEGLSQIGIIRVIRGSSADGRSMLNGGRDTTGQ